jgi:uncharacterized protein with HEPN domain
MTKKTNLQYLEDIIESALLIINWFDDEKKVYQLDETDVLFNATVRRLQVMVEAAKRVDEDLKEKYSNIPWQKISGTRDVLVHNYDEIDHDVLKEIIFEKLPEVVDDLQRLRSDIEQDYYRELAAK